MTLVIMAAGMGSRFGGLKQIEPVNDYGSFIIDYSVYDAIRAGFDKVVFIIKEENFEIFKDTIGKRIEEKIDVTYVFQKITDVPSGVEIPSDRVKPWGTAHAILACKDVVNEPFCVINADDYYGIEPFSLVKEFFNKKRKDSEFALISYLTENTMTENGSVNRGVCYKDENDFLSKIVESKIEKDGSKIIATPLEEGEVYEVESGTLVSMNFWAFTPKLFPYLEKFVNDFFTSNKDNLSKAEVFIPTAVFKMMCDGKATVKIIPTDAVWHGITYKEDKDELVSALKELTFEGKYPKDLWN